MLGKLSQRPCVYACATEHAPPAAMRESSPYWLAHSANALLRSRPTPLPAQCARSAYSAVLQGIVVQCLELVAQSLCAQPAHQKLGNSRARRKADSSRPREALEFPDPGSLVRRFLATWVGRDVSSIIYCSQQKQAAGFSQPTMHMRPKQEGTASTICRLRGCKPLTGGWRQKHPHLRIPPDSLATGPGTGPHQGHTGGPAAAVFRV